MNQWPEPVMNADSEERRRSAEQFRIAIEAAPAGMLMVDRNGRIALVNAQVEKIFGYRREELLNEPVEILVPERFRGGHPDHRSGFFHAPDARPMGRGRDVYGLRKDGTEVPIEIGLNPLRTPEGDCVLSSVADISERRRAEHEREDLMGQLKALNADLEDRVQRRTSELTGALKEREILLQEVHHRVKNNLQVISSLLSMQARKLDEGTTRDAVEECQTRVQAIALIHEKLYQSKDYARVPFSEYARSLANNVFHAIDVSPSTVTLDLAIEDLVLGVDRAIPCGLVLNELITNALKHGFTDGRSGTIRVELVALDDGRLRLAVHDNGVGLPEGVDIQKSDSLGFQLVRTLAEQLDAVLEVDGRAGASIQLTFPAEA
jgi:PAS domain S-box-containing protein